MRAGDDERDENAWGILGLEVWLWGWMILLMWGEGWVLRAGDTGGSQ